MTTNPMPKAKTERLIVREIDGETLVYDRGRDAANCLNGLVARVWRECNGETSVAEIAAALGEDEHAVWLALHQLTKAQLLPEAIAFSDGQERRQEPPRDRGAVGVGRGSANYEAGSYDHGEVYVWLEPAVANRLRAMRGPGRATAT
jgi:hypothetical protein